MIEMTKNTPLTLDTSAYIRRICDFLQTHLPEFKKEPTQLASALHYTTLNGGKRLRPLLVYLTGEALGASLQALDAVAASVECIHCYSMIHDDLPAMDDDLLRRGLPTCHIKFDEATAILAGDALQALAFEFLCHHTVSADISAKSRIAMVQLLAKASGFQGMVGGQALDLAAEGASLSALEIQNIHQKKTGALIEASILLGALAAETTQKDETFSILAAFGQHIGLAFQLQDDLLDVVGDTIKIGKKTGQDDKQNKSTYTRIMGIEKTRTTIDTLFDQALLALEKLPHNTEKLAALCHKLMNRDH